MEKAKRIVKRLIRYPRKLYWARKRRRRQIRKWKPTTIYPDDLFIVSYPKSGTTWVRFLLANLLKPPGEEDVDFYIVDRYIPEIETCREIIEALKRPRMIQSHAYHLREYPQVIYIVRDGRDVYVSYYYHRLRKLPPGITFKEFLMGRHPPSLWGDHVTSWLFKEHKRPLRMLVVRYEDLLQDSLSQLRRMVEFIGIETTEERLEEAARASSFENMRRLELERGRSRDHVGPDVFVREGRQGSWKTFFGAEEKAIFKARGEGRALIKLGYERDDDW